MEEELEVVSNKYRKAKADSEHITSEINTIKKEIEGKNGNKSSNNEKIGSLTKEIEQIKATSSSIKTLNDKVESDKKILNRLIFLDSIFGLDGIQTRIIKKYLPLLNVYVKEFLDLLGNGEITIELFINDRSEVDFNIKGNSSNIYALLSGGEQGIARLSVSIGMALLSFSKSSTKPELICLDEIFSALDVDREDAVFLLLNKLKAKFSRIMVISHRKTILDRIEHKILVEKEPGDLGYSKIEKIV